MTPAPGLSVVVPAFNEAGRLPAALAELAAAIDRGDTEVIVVDDGSTDDTAAVAAQALSRFPHGRVISFTANRGKGAAVRAGVAGARGQAIVFMDADLATGLDALPRLVDSLQAAQVAVGSRAARGATVAGAAATRVHLGRSFNRLVRVVTPLQLRDTQCGFKGFRRPAAKLLFHLSQVDGFAFDVEVLALAHRIGYRTAEVPVAWEARPGSHVRPVTDSFAMAADVVRAGWRWRSRRVLSAILAVARGEHRDAAVVALEAALPDAGPVVPWDAGAMALLPFVASAEAQALASGLQTRLPSFAITNAELPARAILGDRDPALRTALAAR